MFAKVSVFSHSHLSIYFVLSSYYLFLLLLPLAQFLLGGAKWLFLSSVLNLNSSLFMRNFPVSCTWHQHYVKAITLVEVFVQCFMHHHQALAFLILIHCGAGSHICS